MAVAVVACTTPSSPAPTPTPAPTSTAGPAAVTQQPRPGDINPQESSKHELPEGWRRVQVREGYVGRDFENPLAGFTIDLPPDWDAAESWPGGDGPAGWIAGAVPEWADYRPTLRFVMGRHPIRSVESLEQDGEHVVTHPVIEGQQAHLYLTIPAMVAGPQVGIHYEHLPGGPGGVDTPSLVIDGDRRGFDDQELLGRVLTSIRYAEIEDLPELPSVDLEPGLDWVRAAARSDFNTFTVLLPPEWEIEQLQGIDTFVGRLLGDGIELSFDFGAFAGIPYDQSGRIRDGRDALHLIWEATDGGRRFFIVRPVSPEPDDRNTTGAYIRQLVQPGQPSATMSISAHGLDKDQQGLALAIMLSVEFEPNPGNRK